jgi:hypothetical protein
MVGEDNNNHVTELKKKRVCGKRKTFSSDLKEQKLIGVA